ncbi:MAG TPA: RNA polymerase sigma factor, partial [Bacteroidota bacterium]|nr:RNA polymerase sigma factor [Bacteroidota bacterium]
DVELLQRALERLPADKREIIVLSKYQDLKYSVIAELLGCSEENVKVRVHRAIAELRKIFMELSGETAS